MVNETHALDAHEFRATALAPMGYFPVAGSRQDEENQKSSFAHAYVTHYKTDF